MSTDTKIKTLIFNKLTQDQYNNADKVPTEFYLTPDDTDEKLAAKQDKLTAGTNITIVDNVISATGGGGSGFDFEGTKAEFDAAVAAGTITDDSVSLITDDVSGDNVATKAELQDKVNKAGDTMSGQLKMLNNNEIRFGTDDNYYYIKKHPNGDLLIYNKDEKGLFLYSGGNKFVPYYYDGTKGYRLLTTADLANIDYVVEYKNPTESDPTWYRKYKNGWLEQGGVVTAAGEVTLLKPFANTAYSVQTTSLYTNYTNWGFGINKTSVSSFHLNMNSGTQGAMWEAKGMGAN